MSTLACLLSSGGNRGCFNLGILAQRGKGSPASNLDASSTRPDSFSAVASEGCTVQQPHSLVAENSTFHRRRSTSGSVLLQGLSLVGFSSSCPSGSKRRVNMGPWVLVQTSTTRDMGQLGPPPPTKVTSAANTSCKDRTILLPVSMALPLTLSYSRLLTHPKLHVQSMSSLWLFCVLFFQRFF